MTLTLFEAFLLIMIVVAAARYLNYGQTRPVRVGSRNVKYGVVYNMVFFDEENDIAILRIKKKKYPRQYTYVSCDMSNVVNRGYWPKRPLESILLNFPNGIDIVFKEISRDTASVLQYKKGMIIA